MVRAEKRGMRVIRRKEVFYREEGVISELDEGEDRE